MVLKLVLTGNWLYVYARFQAECTTDRMQGLSGWQTYCWTTLLHISRISLSDNSSAHRFQTDLFQDTFTIRTEFQRRFLPPQFKPPTRTKLSVTPPPDTVRRKCLEKVGIMRVHPEVQTLMCLPVLWCPAGCTSRPGHLSGLSAEPGVINRDLIDSISGRLPGYSSRLQPLSQHALSQSPSPRVQKHWTSQNNQVWQKKKQPKSHCQWWATFKMKSFLPPNSGYLQLNSVSKWLFIPAECCTKLHYLLQSPALKVVPASFRRDHPHWGLQKHSFAIACDLIRLQKHW